MLSLSLSPPFSHSYDTQRSDLGQSISLSLSSEMSQCQVTAPSQRFTSHSVLNEFAQHTTSCSYWFTFTITAHEVVLQKWCMHGKWRLAIAVYHSSFFYLSPKRKRKKKQKRTQNKASIEAGVDVCFICTKGIRIEMWQSLIDNNGCKSQQRLMRFLCH